MTMQAADALLLGGKAVAIAALLLALVWIGRAPKTGGDRLRRLAWLTAFVTFDLIVFGGFTRLTDSGLGCPDWPGCYAKANPWMASGDIHSAEAAMPSGPVTMHKAWIEMIHRYLAMTVGLLIVAIVVVSVRRAMIRRTSSGGPGRMPARPGFAVALLALVVVQGAFGAWTVTQRLQPIFVAGHLLLGMALLASLVWHALLLDDGAATWRPAPADPSRASGRVPAWLAVGALAILVVQIALGGWVSANYAVLACNDFPACQGAWLPPMDFANAFDPWRPLGRTTDGGYLSLAALTAIHWTHRAVAWIVVAVLGWLAWSARRADRLVRPAAALGLLLAVQFATGFANVVFDWPLAAAVLHNAGAAALVAVLVVINYRVAFGSTALAREDDERGAASSLSSARRPPRAAPLMPSRDAR